MFSRAQLVGRRGACARGVGVPNLRGCFPRETLRPHPPPPLPTMSLPLAARAGRLARQLPPRQAAIGAAAAARRIHSSASAKGASAHTAAPTALP